MLQKQLLRLNVGVLAAVIAVGTTGCEQLPGSKEAQGATIGGLGGAAAGAVIAGKDNRLLGAILGGALGAGGGYVIGANSDRIKGRDKSGAEAAAQKAQSTPATAQEAMNAPTADLNSDGFVTMDEVIAMRNAGLSDEQMLEKLRATDQVFELTAEQRSYLETHGVSANVVDQMSEINRDTKERLMSSTDSDLRDSSSTSRDRTGESEARGVPSNVRPLSR